jgi:alpha-ketoglutarate-dependent taurine dioxygenase
MRMLTDQQASGSPLQCVTEPGHPAGLTISAADLGEACEWITANRGPIRGALHAHGALYLHSLPVASVEDFARVRDAVVGERAAYKEQATPRSHFGADVYSSTDLPPSQSIRPHNENSYTLTFPGVLVFGCLIAPETGGATPVTDVRSVLANIPAPLVSRFRESGWGLVRNYADHLGLSWSTAFGTQDKDVVAKYCEENLIAHEWCADGHLRTVQRRSALIRHPLTAAEVWFNHVVFWNEWALDPDVREVFIEDLGAENLPFGTVYGDGEPVGKSDVEVIDEAYRQATVRETWKPGDVMLVDNILSAHGRESFRGDRKILVAMGDEVALDDCEPTVRPLAGFAEPATGPEPPAAPPAAPATAGAPAPAPAPGPAPARGWKKLRGNRHG